MNGEIHYGKRNQSLKKKKNIYMPYKGLLFLIYKELLKINQKEMTKATEKDRELNSQDRNTKAMNTNVYIQRNANIEYYYQIYKI